VIGPEKTKVEDPFIDQLVRMGWQHITGNLDHASVTGRESFREVLILDDLRKALRRINRDESGEEWLDEGRISTAVSALQHLGTTKLIEANEAAHTLLLGGVSVEGVPGWDGGRNRTVHFIDWEHPENNRFTVVSQFRVDEPHGQAHSCITPDLVLFVNGIPPVVVECKAPTVSEPMESAIDQIQRYSNQRDWVDGSEGNERLFHTNAFTVATCFDEARVGTISASSVHYLEWKDTSPVPLGEVAAGLGKQNLSSQERLVAGMLRPAHLLDIVRHFIVFEVEGGKTIKKVARYQQFRAVHAAIERLATGATLAQDGEHDRRGGIIWHTQGSGKSLTMVFLVKQMRSHPSLRRFKIVFVTDRRPLQKQLSETAALTGDVVKIPDSSAKLKEALAERGPALVFGTIQKYQDRVDDGEDADVPEFPVLNEDESILVMVDEAHRSHAKKLHANLLQALPRSARIGFTGTPIIMGAKKKTHEIFGEFIDRYTIQQSEADGATLKILYEGRTTEGAVADGRNLDELFEDMFRERTPEELQAIKAKYATKGDVLEAEKLIAAKARDMLRHYVDNILPNGFKAQVVAVSRRATVRYYKAFLAARDDLVREIENLAPDVVAMSQAERSHLPPRTQFLLRARELLERIKALEFAPVFSVGDHNDPADWTEWTDPAKIEKRIADFKKPFDHKDPEKRSNLAFLIVKAMLITGFDAPIIQVQYLDRGIREAELLQAIARVNRTYLRKTAGIVVDYYGVAAHLKSALAAYSVEDIEGALTSINDELPILRDRQLRAIGIFTERGRDVTDEEGCVELLADEQLRAEFRVKLKLFLNSLDTVLPRPEALLFVADAVRLGKIAYRARKFDRDPSFRPIGKDVGEKVRKLIDDHLVSLGIDPKVPPVSILDAAFDGQVKATPSARTRASEMEHALRYHLRKHLDEDPEHYGRLSQRLEEILAELKDRWDEVEKALKGLIDEARAGRREAIPGLDAEIHAPFFGVLKQAVVGKVELAAEDQDRLAEVAVELVDHIRQEIRIVGFWSNAHAQDVLRKWIVGCLDERDVLPFARLPEVADRLMEVAKANHPRLTR
jgi:type I restriction enzyme, R subunit